VHLEQKIVRPRAHSQAGCPRKDKQIDVMSAETSRRVSRRAFIKGVIAGGAAVASANYLFRASTLLARQSLLDASPPVIADLLLINTQ
jgi:hypothetical protein